MADYTTKAVTIKDVTVTVSKAKSPSAGDRLEAFLVWLHENWVDPGYGKPEGPSGRPDNTLPGAGGAPRPDQGLPDPKPGEIPGNKPDNTLPGKPPGEATQPRPDQGLPGKPPGSAEQPGIDNSLPDFIGDNAKAIAKEILGHCVNCNTAQPK